MGIPGLTTYIEKRANYYLEPFELHDTILIIDGWNLSSQLYSSIATCNHAFGGDYDQFAHCVFQFFKDLLQCKVTPLVLLDGGWERKKKHTLIERFKQRIKIAKDYGILNTNPTFFPLLLPEVFVDVMKKIGVCYAMCPFEADDSVSSIAKILNVPVLSYDSDFFIYGVDYIPFNTLKPSITKYGHGYVKKCCIYHVEKLLDRFKGLDISILPLASILLGNDYIDRKVFVEFLSRLNIRRTKNQNEQQRRIEIVFCWLRNYSLNTAVATILKRMPYEKRRNVLQSIEVIVNGYFRLSTYMLQPLGVDVKNILETKKCQKFKYHGDLDDCGAVNNLSNDLEFREESNEIQNRYKMYQFEVENVEDYVNEDRTIDYEQEWDEGKFSASIPQWFIDDHLAGKFPHYFINIVVHHVYMVPVQIEDYSCCSAQKISLPIIRTICSLLTSSRDHITNNTFTVIQLLIREGFRLDRQYLSVPLSFIAFEDIRRLSVIQRKKIIDDTLQINVGDKLDNLPTSWQLYIAAILFWMRQKNDINPTNVHLDTLLLSMLLGIIDRTIGFNRRNMNRTLHKEFGGAFGRIQEDKRYERITNDDKTTVISNLISSITLEDCTTAMTFFLDHVNNKLYSMPKAFSINTVHVYAQFQACLRHAMHLNALLGNVYTQPSPSEFMNGTIFYNLYNNISTRSDVHTYISTKLRNSSKLLEVFKALHETVFDLLPNIIIGTGVKNSNRKRRKGKKMKKVKKSTDESDSAIAQCVIDNVETMTKFYDPSNPFTLLCNLKN